MKSLLYILLLLNSLVLFAQRDYIYGSVVDSTHYPLSDVYIRNISAGSITNTDTEGDFRIPAQLGDTLSISYIGYETLQARVDETWILGEPATIRLMAKTTFLDEVTVTKFPEYQQFKEQIMATDPADTSFQVYGVPKVAITEEDRLNASLAIRGPFSAVHNAFSKRAKEQKKVRKMLQNQGNREKARTKFSREWVSEMTSLQGEKLTSFIAFCNFSEAYLVSTPEYVIHEDMMALLPKFLQEYDREG